MNERGLRTLVLVAMGASAAHCRRTQTSSHAPDGWEFSRPDVRDSRAMDAGAARTARDAEDAARSAALAVAWRDLEPGRDPCPVTTATTDDLIVVINGRTTSAPRRQTAHETVVVLDAPAPDRAIARVYVFDRAEHRMVCGDTVEVSGQLSIRDAIRRAQLKVLVDRGGGATSGDAGDAR